MARKPIFPKLAGKMGAAGESERDLAPLLEVSIDTVRRTLRGQRQFELVEIYRLLEHYKCNFEDLFGEAS